MVEDSLELLFEAKDFPDDTCFMPCRRDLEKLYILLLVVLATLELFFVSFLAVVVVLAAAVVVVFL